jgi:hypothetical protein
MKLKNLGLGAAGFAIALWSTHYSKAQTVPQPLYGSSAGIVNAVSVATTLPVVTSSGGTQAAYLVAAVVNSNRKLEVIVWQDTGKALNRLALAPVPPQPTSKTGVAATELDANRVVTADCDSTGVLSIDTWNINSSGAVLENSASTAPNTATAVSIARLNSSEVITAIETFKGELVIEAWEISSSGLPTLAAIAYSDVISEVAIAALSDNQVATAVRNSKGDLEVLVWAVGGTVINRLIGSEVTAGPVSQVSIAGAGGNAYTSVINSMGDLEVIYWTVKRTGLHSVAISRTDSGTADPASRVASCLLSSASSNPITAVCGGSSYLEVEAWTSALPRATHTTYHTISPITSVATTTTGSDPNFDYFATAVRSSTGDLEVQKWAYALHPILP